MLEILLEQWKVKKGKKWVTNVFWLQRGDKKPLKAEIF